MFKAVHVEPDTQVVLFAIVSYTSLATKRISLDLRASPALTAALSKRNQHENVSKNTDIVTAYLGVFGGCCAGGALTGCGCRCRRRWNGGRRRGRNRCRGRHGGRCARSVQITICFVAPVPCATANASMISRCTYKAGAIRSAHLRKDNGST